MKYCKHCGKELLDEAVICSNCGNSVKSADCSTTGKRSGIGKALKIIAIVLGSILYTAYFLLILYYWWRWGIENALQLIPAQISGIVSCIILFASGIIIEKISKLK